MGNKVPVVGIVTVVVVSSPGSTMVVLMDSVKVVGTVTVTTSPSPGIVTRKERG